MDTTGLSPESRREPKGNPASFVTVVEFSDLQCPGCRTAHDIIVKPLLQKYGGSIRFEFYHFPLFSIHPYALDAAQAAECAADQGRFWEFVEIAYAGQDALDRKVLPRWAADAGVQDIDLFRRCLASGIKKDTIMSDVQLGEELEVQGTPTFFVDGRKVEATITDLGDAIDEATVRLSEVPL